jgi:hypothetical protein
MIPFFTRMSALYVSVAVMMVPFFIKVVINRSALPHAHPVLPKAGFLLPDLLWRVF